MLLTESVMYDGALHLDAFERFWEIIHIHIQSLRGQIQQYTSESNIWISEWVAPLSKSLNMPLVTYNHAVNSTLVAIHHFLQ